VVGRQPFGRISIANADADAFAYGNAAIDQAFRAVKEISRFGVNGRAKDGLEFKRLARFPGGRTHAPNSCNQFTVRYIYKG
jgi:hypothetical protein